VRVDYGVGLARNSRLETMLVPWMEQARAIRAITGNPSRAFAEFDYQTRSGSWSRWSECKAGTDSKPFRIGRLAG